jgi:hypothetical protein
MKKLSFTSYLCCWFSLGQPCQVCAFFLAHACYSLGLSWSLFTGLFSGCRRHVRMIFLFFFVIAQETSPGQFRCSISFSHRNLRPSTVCLGQWFVLFDFCSRLVKIRFSTEIWPLWFKSIFLFLFYHCSREISCRRGSSKRISSRHVLACSVLDFCRQFLSPSSRFQVTPGFICRDWLGPDSIQPSRQTRPYSCAWTDSGFNAHWRFSCTDFPRLWASLLVPSAFELSF